MTWSDKAAVVIGVLALGGGITNLYQYNEKEKQQHGEPNWVGIGTAEGGAPLAFDSSSLTVDGSQRTAWMRLAFSPPRNMGAGVMHDNPVTRYLMLATYDCSRRTMQMTQVIVHDVNNESQSETLHSPPEVVAPGTNGQPMLDGVCAAPTKNWFRWVLAFVGSGKH